MMAEVDGENIFSVTDFRGKIVVFTKAKWEEKRSDHPELNKKTFLACLERAIREPDAVWEDYDDPRRKRCYYKKYSGWSYAKAVVWAADNPCRIVTAYEISKMKEENHPHLKRVR